MKIFKKVTAVMLALMMTAAFFKALAVDGQQVDAVDAIAITATDDPDVVYAEWTAAGGNLQVYESLVSLQAVRLVVDWSVAEGEIHEGDFFLVAIPDIFDVRWVESVYNAPITDKSGEVVATYSIYVRNGVAEARVVFTQHADGLALAGDFWCTLFVANVSESESKPLEFVINGNVVTGGEITTHPIEIPDEVPSGKAGYSDIEAVFDGYFVLSWTVILNVAPSSDGSGYAKLENFSFTDTIPQNSPHVFITETVAESVGVPQEYVGVLLREYTGSDDVAPPLRYLHFVERAYSTQDSWFDYMTDAFLQNGHTSDGLDSLSGIEVSGFEAGEKSVSASLGTLTRPTVLTYYTITTTRLHETALGDPEVVDMFTNRFVANTGEEMDSTLVLHDFGSGGSAISGDLSFTIKKVNESGNGLSGAVFSLYADLNEANDDTALRIAISGEDGEVTFAKLSPGTYYLRERTAPNGYLMDEAIYMVVLSEAGCRIYGADGFTEELEQNEIVNLSESEGGEQPEEEPDPSPQPSQTPDPSPQPSQTPDPSPQPSQTPDPSPQPSQTPDPSPQPSQTPDPSPQPSQSPDPSPQPSQTPDPSPQPSQTPDPSPQPSQTPDPSPQPSPEPTQPPLVDDYVPGTGDASMLTLWRAVFALSAVVGVNILSFSRGKK